MSGAAAEVFVRIAADISQYQAAMRALPATTHQAMGSAVASASALSGALTDASQGANRAARALGEVGAAAAGVGRQASAAASALGGIDGGGRSFTSVAAGAAVTAIKIAAIGAAAALVVRNWGTLGPFFASTFARISSGVGPAAGAISGGFAGAWTRIQSGAAAASAAIGPIFSRSGTAVVTAGSSIASGLQSVWARIPEDLRARVGGYALSAPFTHAFGIVRSHALSLGVLFAGGLAAGVAAHALMAAGQAMSDAGRRAISLAGELEQSKVAFTTMLGSAAKADAFLKDLTAFAANTPFELRGLQDSSKKLLAFGFDARDIIPIMTSVGNAVSGLGGGKDVLDGVTLALGQMGAKGKASAEEMGQLAERGVPAWQFLADKIGKSIPEAMKMAEKGAISGSTAISAIVEGMNKKFPDMMAKQSKTLFGAWSNLTDSIDGLLTRLGTKFLSTFNVTGIIQSATAAVSGLVAFLDAGGLDATLDVIAAAALGMGAAVVAAVAVSAPAITATLIPAVLALAAAWAPAVLAAAPYVALAAVVAAAAYPIIRQWDEVKSASAAVWGLIEAKATEAWQTIRTSAATGMAALTSVWDAMTAPARFAWAAVTEIASSAWGAITRTVTDWIDWFAGGVRQIAGAADAVWGLVVAASTAAWQAVSMTVKGWYGWFVGIGGQIVGAAASMWASVGAAAVRWYEGLRQLAQPVIGVFSAIWGGAEKLALGFLKTVIGLGQKIVDVFKAVGANIGAILRPVFDKVGGLLKGAIDMLPAGVTSNLGAAADSFRNFVGLAGDIVAPMPGMLAGHVAAAGSAFQALPSLASGAFAGLQSMVQTAGDNFVATWSGAMHDFTDAGAAAWASSSAAAATGAANQALHLGKGAAAAGAAAKKHKAAMSEMEKDAKAAGKVYNDLGATLDAIDGKIARIARDGSLADQIAAMTERAKKLDGALLSLAKKHQVDTSEFRRLQGELERTMGTIDQMKTQLVRVTQAQSDWVEGFKGIGKAVAAAQALGVLKAALGDVEAKTATGVAGFDAYAARATELRTAMTALKDAGIAPAAPAMVALAHSIGQADAASARFLAGQKELAETFATLSTALDTNAARAQAFGASYNQAEADVASMEQALDKLLAAKDRNWEAIKRLQDAIDDARGPFGRAARAADGFRKALGDFKSPLSDLDGGLKTIGDTLGINVGQGFTGAALKAVEFGAAIAQAGAALPALAGFITTTAIPALAGFATFLTATAIPAVIAAIPAIGVGMTTAFGAMAVAVNAALWPVGLVVAAVAGVIVVGQALHENWDAIGSALAPIWNGIAGAAGAAFGFVSGIVTGAGEMLAAPFVAAWQAVAGILGPIWDGIVGAASAAFTALGDVLGKVALGLAPIWDGIVGVIKGGVNLLIGIVNTLIRGMNRISIDVPSWVPGIGNKRFGVSIPEVPYLAAGGVTTGPAMAMIGEGRFQEAVLPLSQDTYRQMGAAIAASMPVYPVPQGQSQPPVVREAVGPRGDITINLNFTGKGKWSKQDADELGALLVGKLKAAGVRA